MCSKGIICDIFFFSCYHYLKQYRELCKIMISAQINRQINNKTPKGKFLNTNNKTTVHMQSTKRSSKHATHKGEKLNYKAGMDFHTTISSLLLRSAFKGQQNAQKHTVIYDTVIKRTMLLGPDIIPAVP